MPIEGVELFRVLEARPERVFEAWTKPDLMARWFFPMATWTATIESDLRVGGRWVVDMREPDGKLHRQFGEYREVTPTSRLVFTWSSSPSSSSRTSTARRFLSVTCCRRIRRSARSMKVDGTVASAASKRFCKENSDAYDQ
jgi:uncharacterized protein YndB with AHSA1/START domain